MLLSSRDLGSRALLSSKLLGARFPLYRSQILQENSRWKALAEIYTMHSFARLCNLNFLSKICQKIAKILKNPQTVTLAFLKNFAIFKRTSSNIRGNNLIFLAVQRSAFCRSRREFSNAYFLAKFRFDTAENEPSEGCPIEAMRGLRAPGRRGAGPALNY